MGADGRWVEALLWKDIEWSKWKGSAGTADWIPNFEEAADERQCAHVIWRLAGKKGAEGSRRATWTAAGPPRPKYRGLQLMLARL